MKKHSLTFSVLLILFISSCSNESKLFFERESSQSFEDSLQDAEFAITEYNFRIINQLHIGQAIQERDNKPFPQNEVFLFCNLTITKQMLNLESRYINYCPYNVTIAEQNDKIIISSRLFPEKTGRKPVDKMAKDINKILRSIVEYAAIGDLLILENNQNEGNR